MNIIYFRKYQDYKYDDNNSLGITFENYCAGRKGTEIKHKYRSVTKGMIGKYNLITISEQMIKK